MNANLLAPFFGMAFAALVVAIPVLGQFLPLEWRNRAVAPRTRTMLNGVLIMLVGAMVAFNTGRTLLAHGADLGGIVSVAMGGASFGMGFSQLLAAINPKSELGDRAGEWGNP